MGIGKIRSIAVANYNLLNTSTFQCMTIQIGRRIALPHPIRRYSSGIALSIRIFMSHSGNLQGWKDGRCTAHIQRVLRGFQSFLEPAPTTYYACLTTTKVASALFKLFRSALQTPICWSEAILKISVVCKLLS